MDILNEITYVKIHNFFFVVKIRPLYKVLILLYFEENIMLKILYNA